jgi:hypothetical protein
VKTCSTFSALIFVAFLAVPQRAFSQEFNMNEVRSGVETLLMYEDEDIQVAVLQVLDGAAADYASGKDPQTFCVVAAFFLSDGKRSLGMAQQLLEIAKRQDLQPWQEDLSRVTAFKLAVNNQDFPIVTQLHEIAKESAKRLGESDDPTVRSLRNALGYDKHTFALGVDFLFCTSLADQGKYEAAMQAANVLDERLRHAIKFYVNALRNPIDLKKIEDAAIKSNEDRRKAREAKE